MPKGGLPCGPPGLAQSQAASQGLLLVGHREAGGLGEHGVHEEHVVPEQFEGVGCWGVVGGWLGGGCGVVAGWLVGG